MRSTTRSAPWLWPTLTAWTLLLFAVDARQIGTSWAFFDQGARLLRGEEVVHLYAQHPELQIGPVALLVATPFTALGPELGRWLACAVMAAGGPAMLWAVSRLRPSVAPLTLLLAGLPFLLTWAQLGVSAGHLDDVLALGFAVAALHQIKDRPLLAAALLGLAADSKPWALAFVAVLLAAPRRRPVLLVWGGLVALAWLPFVLGDHATLSALSHFSIGNDPGSTLRFFEVDTARTPTWDRTAQLALGLGLGAAVLRRSGPAAVLVTVLAARLLIEPGTHTYYSGGLLAATLVYDLAVSERELPLATLGAFCFYYGPAQLRSLPALHDAAGGSRALLCMLLVALALLTPRSAGEAPLSEERRAQRPEPAPEPRTS